MFAASLPRVATLVYLSGGRAVLGVGLGRDYHYTQFQTLDILLGQAQRHAQQYWDACPDWDWQRRTTSEAFANAYAWVDRLPDTC